MKADINVSTIYYNPQRATLVARRQAIDTLLELVNDCEAYGLTIDEMLSTIEAHFEDDFEDFEETFYSYGWESIAEDFLGLSREDDEEQEGEE